MSAGLRTLVQLRRDEADLRRAELLVAASVRAAAEDVVRAESQALHRVRARLQGLREQFAAPADLPTLQGLESERSALRAEEARIATALQRAEGVRTTRVREYWALHERYVEGESAARSLARVEDDATRAHARKKALRSEGEHEDQARFQRERSFSPR
jgi:hypothetical protein